MKVQSDASGKEAMGIACLLISTIAIPGITAAEKPADAWAAEIKAWRPGAPDPSVFAGLATPDAESAAWSLGALETTFTPTPVETTYTPTPAPTETSYTPTWTATPSPSATASATPTNSPTPSRTSTPSPTFIPTRSPFPSASPSSSPTISPSPTGRPPREDCLSQILRIVQGTRPDRNADDVVDCADLRD